MISNELGTDIETCAKLVYKKVNKSVKTNKDKNEDNPEGEILPDSLIHQKEFSEVHTGVPIPTPPTMF